MANKEYPDNVDVLCYFVDYNLSNDIICRVGRWESLVNKWHIHTDGKDRYLHDIVEWQHIPRLQNINSIYYAANKQRKY